MTLPSQKEIELALLYEIDTLGGQASPEELYPRVTAHFTQITASDLEEKTKDGKENKWKNRIRWTRQSLVFKKGELERYPRGIWKITEKGRERLRREGIIVPPPPPSPGEPDKLAEKIGSRIQKLAELAKKEKEVVLLLSHDELIEKVKEIGKMLGKIVEGPWGPVYRHDCVWKDNPYANPKLVVEVCDKGNLYKDIVSLPWAVQTWAAKGILVVFEDSDFQAAKAQFPPGSQVYPLKAEDMLKLHSLLQAEYIQAIRSIFSL
jgi:hypothetical protein